MQIVHFATGKCLTVACLAAQGCTANHTAVVEHNQLTLAACDSAETRQHWLLRSADAAERRQRAGGSSISTAADTSFALNVGENGFVQKEFQLYRASSQAAFPNGMAATLANGVFELDSAGAMRPEAGGFSDCVDVCEDTTACGGGSG